MRAQGTPWLPIHNGSNGYHEIRESGPHAGLVATVWCGIEQDAEAERRATLIAAAPELLEACKAMLDAFYLDPLEANCGRAVEMAESAISKACGEAGQ